MEPQALTAESSIYPTPADHIGPLTSVTGPGSEWMAPVQLDEERAHDTNRLLCYALATSIGTGGVGVRALYALEEQLHATGSGYNIRYRASPEIQRPTVLSISHYTAVIKSAFGLSMSNLATILRVQRPTVYTWLDPDTAPEVLRSVNRDRLISIFDLAMYWNRLSNRPVGEYGSSLSFDGDSFLTLLSRESIDRSRIEAVLIEINKYMTANFEPSLGERLRKKGFAELPSKGLYDNAGKQTRR